MTSLLISTKFLILVKIVSTLLAPQFTLDTTFACLKQSIKLSYLYICRTSCNLQYLQPIKQLQSQQKIITDHVSIGHYDTIHERAKLGCIGLLDGRQSSFFSAGLHYVSFALTASNSVQSYSGVSVSLLTSLSSQTHPSSTTWLYFCPIG